VDRGKLRRGIDGETARSVWTAVLVAARWLPASGAVIGLLLVVLGLRVRRRQRVGVTV
jgi:hypothetical protein